MIEIAIVEDDPAYREQLKQYLEQYQNEYKEDIHLTVYTDGDEIIENYKGQFDLILMDVEMEFMDGMTAAEKIRETDQKVIIIFITNMAQYAIKGYAVDALDYVLKPISYFAFSQRIKRAISRMKKREETFLTINTRRGAAIVRAKDIYWIESQRHRLTYFTAQGEYESTASSMKEVEASLEGEHFFRCNQGYLVNLAHVEGVRDGYAQVHGESLQISRSRKNDFMEALVNYAGEAIK